uniref:Prolyl 3-hydroxylase family member 4 (inactive) n=1 Tax=Sphaeramia orbicularis TaxID=375764 RepID=A0A672ZSP1_9TELE
LQCFVNCVLAHYGNYSFKHFPQEELMPLTAAYGLALDHYAAANWTESIRYLEQSLRLHRLLRDSVRYCMLHCNKTQYEEPNLTENQDLRVFWHVTMRASCQKKCREHFPALQLPTPSRETLEDFSRRSPYRYLHFAHSMVNDLQSAIPCAYTYLQKNPEDQQMQQLMDEYKSQYNLSGYLTDYEEPTYEPYFLKGVKLVGSGDFDSSTDHLEEALRLYLHEYELCQADCEGIYVYVDILRCQLKCEETLKPNVGGYFVENFLATIYHYLQYAYYKMNNGRSAVPCAYSYFLLEPEDRVMKQNLQYYKAYSEQWGLQSQHFTPRAEALKYFNQKTAQKQILTFVETFLELDDEDFLGPEEAAVLAPESPDVEFEGMGDYEESIYADWRQPKGKGDAGASDT